MSGRSCQECASAAPPGERYCVRCRLAWRAVSQARARADTVIEGWEAVADEVDTHRWEVWRETCVPVIAADGTLVLMALAWARLWLVTRWVRRVARLTKRKVEVLSPQDAAARLGLEVEA